jgi:hypothetical protein
MMEALKLKVDESGAKVEGMAVIKATKAKKAYVPPREFILDSTFWLVMKEDRNHPYLCVEVVDPIDIPKENR